MSNKKAQNDSMSYLTRTGSHATVPRRIGDNSDLASRSWDVSYVIDSAAKNIQEAIEIQKQIEEEQARYKNLTSEAIELNIKLSETLPYAEFKELKYKRTKLGSLINKSNQKIAILKQKRHKEMHNGGEFSVIFVCIARESLPSDVFETIMETTIKIFREQRQCK